jgi:UDP-N-acetyl-D-mannosaminuronic acid transferase (WecB/TagA/CpsF family)/8-oxo-dGTP pyrophosphatase MutT (NUDIX family)
MSNKISNIDLAGLKIISAEKKDLLDWIETRINNHEKTFIATPYGEFLYEALRNPEFKWILNEFDANIADGISIQWASVFLSSPPPPEEGLGEVAKKNWYFSIIKIFLRMAVTGSQILLAPQKIKKYIPEKITGSDFIWDLAEIAEKNNWSVMLAGGFGDTAEITKQKLLAKFPKLNIVGTSNIEVGNNNTASCHCEESEALGGRRSNPVIHMMDCRNRIRQLAESSAISEKENTEITKGGEAATLLHQIQTLKPDVLFLCLGPFKQERFLIYNKELLPVKLAIGLGGTFDYIAGLKKQPPHFIRKIGLEWLWRLFTQPQRWKRIYNATFNLVISLIKYKVYKSRPWRPNVAIAIISKDNRILICRRRPGRKPKEWSKYRRPENWYFEHWQIPQGGIKKDEGLEQTAIREAREEVGVTKGEILKILPNVRNYFFPIDNMPLFGPNKYKGQSQSLVFMRFSGNLGDIKVDQDEFGAYDWVRKEDLISRLHPARKDLGKIILDNWPK